MMNYDTDKYYLYDRSGYLDILFKEGMLVNGAFLARLVEHLKKKLRRNDGSIGIGSDRSCSLGLRIDRADDVMSRQFSTWGLFDEVVFDDPDQLEVPRIVRVENGTVFTDPEQTLTVGEWNEPAQVLTRQLGRHVGLGLYEDSLAYSVYSQSGNEADPSFESTLIAYFQRG